MHHITHKSRVLFILKKRYIYNDICFDESEKTGKATHLHSGLLNSANQVYHMLLEHGIEAKLVEVVDNNSIDREVHKFKPTDVIVEALWCTPDKFDILQRLHPNVRWIIRLHSETPFIANEGIALEWIFKYLKYKNVWLGINSPRMMEDVLSIIPECHADKIMYIPNYYDLDRNHIPMEKECDEWLNISCFGAIRPLKNQLLQAMAAIRFARETGRKLNFHINGSRVENKGDTVIKNIRALFHALNKDEFKLIEHGWKTPEEFRKLISGMDIAMQVSLTETHNIVSCDAVVQNVPIVVSSEIGWASDLFKADPTDIVDICAKMQRAHILGKFGAYFNKCGLKTYNKHTVEAWLKEFK